MEQVVARVGVAVEGVESIEAAKDKAVDRLRGQVFLVPAPAKQLVEGGAGDEITGQDSRRAQLGQHVGDPDHRMALVVAREQLMAVGLADVVDLLLQPLAELVDQ